MNLIYLALLCGMIATSFVHKFAIAAEATLHAESMVGGTASAVGQNTYAVSIQFHFLHRDLHYCGGGILSNRHILTAAHCFIDDDTNRFEIDDYIVVAGVHQAQNKEEQYRVEREVARIYIPRAYNPMVVSAVGNTRIADIAVLELTSDLGLHQFITHVVLPPNVEPHPTYANEQAVVCGYGHNWVTMRHDPHTNRDVEVCSGSYCYERRFAQVNILPNRRCRNFYRNVLDSQLCGHMNQRSPANPEGLCTGDSGAPLVIGNTIIGVVSSSPDGCRENVHPAMYTRVTSFMPFIVNAMNGVRTANMRLAQYEIGWHHAKVLVEQ